MLSRAKNVAVLILVPRSKVLVALILLLGIGLPAFWLLRYGSNGWLDASIGLGVLWTLMFGFIVTPRSFAFLLGWKKPVPTKAGKTKVENIVALVLALLGALALFFVFLPIVFSAYIHRDRDVKIAQAEARMALSRIEAGQIDCQKRLERFCVSRLEFDQKISILRVLKVFLAESEVPTNARELLPEGAVPFMTGKAYRALAIAVMKKKTEFWIMSSADTGAKVVHTIEGESPLYHEREKCIEEKSTSCPW